MKQNTIISKPPILDAMSKADPEILLHAISIVMSRYYSENMEPGAERWQSDTRRYRKDLIEDIFMQWSSLAGTDEIFPWHDDFVAEMWVKFRKQDRCLKRKSWDYFGVRLPASFSESDGNES